MIISIKIHCETIDKFDAYATALLMLQETSLSARKGYCFQNVACTAHKDDYENSRRIRVLVHTYTFRRRHSLLMPYLKLSDS